MQIKTLQDYHTSENTYVIINNGSALVIDPAYDVDGIIKASDGAQITHILITHCHYDHISSLNELRKATGAKVIASENGSKNIGNPSISLTAACMDGFVCDPADIIVSDGEEFEAADLCIKAIYTPGHTSCGMCYLIGDSIFVGDTLFLRNVGRWDLPTGDEAVLVKSIKEKLYTLDEGVKVYSGHGNATSIGYEKKFNLYVKAD